MYSTCYAVVSLMRSLYRKTSPKVGKVDVKLFLNKEIDGFEKRKLPNIVLYPTEGKDEIKTII